MPVIDADGYANISCRRCGCNFRGKVEWGMCPGCMTKWRKPKCHFRGEGFLRAYPATEPASEWESMPLSVSVEPGEPGKVRVLDVYRGPEVQARLWEAPDAVR